MYIQALSKSLPRSSWLPAGTLLLVGAVIASMAGFDIVFNAITGDMPWIREAANFRQKKPKQLMDAWG
jgi:hypothetical protein